MGIASKVGFVLPLWVAVATACGGGGGGGAAAGGVDPASDAAAETASLRAHVLARAGYGPDAWSLARIERLGVDAYIEEQLHPASVPDPIVEEVLAGIPSLSLGHYDVMEAYVDARSLVVLELTIARLARSMLSHRQLEQVLVDFWFDHFNVDAREAKAAFAVGAYERDAIRPHVLGRFEDMLYAVARHAAMLYYLDNHRSTKQGFVFRGETRGLNENYARELLEVHTLGAPVGFDQQDVVEVARAFTGWTTRPRQFSAVDGFYYWDDFHDQDAKQVMGRLFMPPGGGMQDGLDVIHFLATHPRTARFLCRRLAERLVSERPPRSLIDNCAAAFLATDGDLRAVTRGLLISAAFRDPANRGGKVKRPLALVASLMRATGASPGIALNELVTFLPLLGEPPYQAPAPTGHPEASRHWAAPGTLLTRFNLVARVVALDAELAIDWGVTGGTSSEIVDSLSQRLLSVSADPGTRDALIGHLERLGAIPDAQRVREAARLLLSSPDFQRY